MAPQIVPLSREFMEIATYHGDGSWLMAICNSSASNASLHTSQYGVPFTANGVTLSAFSPDLQVHSLPAVGA